MSPRCQQARSQNLYAASLTFRYGFADIALPGACVRCMGDGDVRDLSALECQRIRAEYCE